MSGRRIFLSFSYFIKYWYIPNFNFLLFKIYQISAKVFFYQKILIKYSVKIIIKSNFKIIEKRQNWNFTTDIEKIWISYRFTFI